MLMLGVKEECSSHNSYTGNDLYSILVYEQLIIVNFDRQKM